MNVSQGVRQGKLRTREEKRKQPKDLYMCYPKRVSVQSNWPTALCSQNHSITVKVSSNGRQNKWLMNKENLGNWSRSRAYHKMMAESHQALTLRIVKAAWRVKRLVKKVFIAKRTAKLACRAKKRLKVQLEVRHYLRVVCRLMNLRSMSRHLLD